MEYISGEVKGILCWKRSLVIIFICIVLPLHCSSTTCHCINTRPKALLSISSLYMYALMLYFIPKHIWVYKYIHIHSFYFTISKENGLSYCLAPKLQYASKHIWIFFLNWKPEEGVLSITFPLCFFRHSAMSSSKTKTKTKNKPTSTPLTAN